MNKRHIPGFFDALARTPSFAFLCTMLMCGAAAGLWTRLFALLFSDHVASPVLALAMTLTGAGMLCLALLRLCGLHPLRYLAARRE